MKKLATALLLAAAFTVVGCNDGDADSEVISGSNYESEASETASADDKVYTVVDQQPEFPGGVQAMYRFLGENIRYPEETFKKHSQGKVFLTFVVSSTGKIREVEVLKGVDRSLDQEAMRVVKTMPRWIPGRNDGKKVAVRFNLPIGFKLE